MSQDLLLDRIGELLDREHAAISMVDIDELEAVDAERRNLLDELGPIGESDREAYLEIESRRARNERAAEIALTRIGGALGRVGRGTIALKGYRPTVWDATLSRALDREV
jgi:hypothetical protein